VVTAAEKLFSQKGGGLEPLRAYLADPNPAVNLILRTEEPERDLAAGLKKVFTEYAKSAVIITCKPDAAGEAAAATARGPVLPGTGIRCTEEVLHRLGRIPIPFVRQMVTQRVAETARAEQVALVDVSFFERAATF